MDRYNINGKIIIGIDHGYGNMKTRHTVFKSGVKAYDSKPVVTDNVLEYNGIFYVIGESHKVFIANKDEDDDYYILTLVAIAKELSIRGRTEAIVNLAVGLPIYWMKTQKEEFKRYLMRNPEVEYVYKNVTYKVKIDDVAVFPQGFAGVAADMDSYKGIHMLADIGNGTMNTVTFVNGKGISDKVYTDKIGVHQCMKRIVNEVQAECGKLPAEYVIEDFLINGKCDASEKMISVMRKEAKKYTEEIFDKLHEYDYDPDMVWLHIIGGGGCLIKNFGSYNPDRVQIISDICATAKGYENLYMATKLRRGA